MVENKISFATKTFIFLLFCFQTIIFASEPVEITDEVLINRIELLWKSNKSSSRQPIDALKSHKSKELISLIHYERLTELLVLDTKYNNRKYLISYLLFQQRNREITAKSVDNLIQSFSFNRYNKNLANILINQQTKYKGLTTVSFNNLLNAAKYSPKAINVLASTNPNDLNFVSSVNEITSSIVEGKIPEIRLAAIEGMTLILTHVELNNSIITSITKAALNDTHPLPRIEAVKFIIEHINEHPLKIEISKKIASDIPKHKFPGKVSGNQDEYQLIGDMSHMLANWHGLPYPSYLVDSWIAVSYGHAAKYIIPFLEKVSDRNELSSSQYEALLKQSEKHYGGSRKQLIDLLYINKALNLNDLLLNLNNDDYSTRLRSGYLIDLYFERNGLPESAVDGIYNHLISEKTSQDLTGILTNLLMKYGRNHRNQEDRLINIYNHNPNYNNIKEAFFDLVIFESDIETVIYNYGRKESIPGGLRTWLLINFSGITHDKKITKKMEDFLRDTARWDSEREVREIAARVLKHHGKSLPIRTYLDIITDLNLNRDFNLEDLAVFFVVSTALFFAILVLLYSSFKETHNSTKRLIISGAFAFLFALSLRAGHGFIIPWPAILYVHEGVFKGDINSFVAGILPIIIVWCIVFGIMEKFSNDSSESNSENN